MQGIDEWLTGEDESTVAGVGEGARGGGNGGTEGNLGEGLELCASATRCALNQPGIRRHSTAPRPGKHRCRMGRARARREGPMSPPAQPLPGSARLLVPGRTPRQAHELA